MQKRKRKTEIDISEIERQWRKGATNSSERIKQFGYAMIPDLREKLNLLDEDILKLQKQVEVKKWILAKVGLLSLGIPPIADVGLIPLKKDRLWFGEEVIRIFYEDQLKQIETERKRIVSAIQILEGKNIYGTVREITLDEIEEARQFPLGQLAESYVLDLRCTGSRCTGTCPFHSDRTPSFKIKVEQNIFRCFGCGEKGDAITFLRKIENLTFIHAVKVLLYLLRCGTRGVKK